VELQAKKGNCVGPTESFTIDVQPNPQPDFEFQPSNSVCINNQPIAINYTGDANVDSFSWRLGDGALPGSTTEPNPDDINYRVPGDKTVMLQVSRGNCTNQIEKEISILPKPKASFEILSSKEQCANENAFQVENTSNTVGASNVTYSWDFLPDGNPMNSAQENPGAIEYASAGEKEIMLQITAAGCSDEVMKKVQVRPHPEKPETINDSICSGFYAILRVDTPQTGNYEWYDSPRAQADDSIAHGDTLKTTGRLTSTNTYYVRSRNSFGCTSEYTEAEAYVYPDNSVAITANRDTAEIPNAIVTFSPNVANPGRVTQYEWAFGDKSTANVRKPSHQYRSPGNYTVTLTLQDSNGCVYSDVLKNAVTIQERNSFFIPTGFSPNGDQRNEFLEINSRLITDLTMKVYARNGQEVYRTNDPTFRWDGTDKQGQPLPAGVYIYHLKATKYNGNKIQRKGTVTIIR
jgi:gliding motility-associated-like protein